MLEGMTSVCLLDGVVVLHLLVRVDIQIVGKLVGATRTEGKDVGLVG